MAVSRSKPKKASLRVELKGHSTPAGPDPFKQFFPIGEAIATLLHPYAEVVLHDLRTGRIVRVWNSFTERQAGDLSNLNEAKAAFPRDRQVLGPYDKALASQGRTKSITAAMRDEHNELTGFLCINLDVTLIDNAAAVLTAFASSEMKRPEPIYRNDMKQHISYLVRDYSLRVNRPVDKLTKEQRGELVAIIDREGLFQARNSVLLVATAMKISRASVYNLLNAGNDKPKGNGHSAGHPKEPAHRSNSARAGNVGAATTEGHRRPRLRRGAMP
jgi:predicted transcriptional regulator YheO